jgi:hypothetical protein
MIEHDGAREPVEEAIHATVVELLINKGGRPVSALASSGTLMALAASMGYAPSDRVKWFDGGLSMWAPGGYIDFRTDTSQPRQTIRFFDSEGKHIASTTTCW